MAIITGTTGNDNLVDEAEADTITALAGDDTILVTTGRDTVDGGDGTDSLIVLYPDADYDVVNDSTLNDNAYSFDNATGDAPDSVSFQGIENVDITTGSGNDTIHTFFHVDGEQFVFQSGDDRIVSGAGNDRIAGGDGNDFLDAGDGDDILDGDGKASGKFGGSFGGALFIGDDELVGGAGNDRLYGGNGSDILDGGIGDDELYGDLSVFDLVGAQDSNGNGTSSVAIQENTGSDSLSGNDTLIGGEGNDLLVGNAGDDTIDGGTGNDTVRATITRDGADTVDLGEGDDLVEISVNANSEVSNAVRLTFTSAEVGNGTALDSNAMANQDGGLALRLQSEDYDDGLVGPISRYDDEGVTFVAQDSVTFDVRDLVAGTERGDQFKVVALGTAGNDTMSAVLPGAYYFNAGMGDDTIDGGDANDFLVGGAGNDTQRGNDGDDTLLGGAGDDLLIGGAGADRIEGGDGNDTIDSLDRPTNIFAGNIAPVSDTVLAGAGDDSVTAGRLDVLDGGDGDDFLSINFGFNGPDDAPAVVISTDADGVISADDGTSAANFERVNFTLTEGNDTSDTGDVAASISGEEGDDTITTGAGDDVVFGGAGTDILTTGAGDDTIGGGEGDDTIRGGAGDDSLSVNAQTDGSDDVDLGEGFDSVDVGGNVGFTGQVRLTFTSSEVGNGNALESGNVAGQDGDLAVRFQLEDGSDGLTGPVSRYDDEGIEFVQAQQGLTFDVRDISGTQRGDQFVGVVLGTSGDDDLSFFPPFQANSSYYYNAGMGNDTVTGGNAEDFLVGGAGNDTLNAGAGDDTLLGGAGDDALDGGAGTDTAIYTGLFSSYTGDDFGQFVTLTAAEGDDRLTGVEILQFSDGTIDLDDGNALFDTLYYYSQNPDVFASGLNALDHYNQFGADEGRDPNAFFDTSGYLAVNADVVGSGFNALEHYQLFGVTEGRDIAVNFDAGVYLAQNPDVAASDLGALEHFLSFGRAEGRAANEAVGEFISDDGFDATYYLLANDDVAASGLGAREHYDSFGNNEDRDTSSVFDTSFYLAQNPDVAASTLDPLMHYDMFGADEGRDPSAEFDTSFYLDSNPDVAASDFNPVTHYLRSGIYEGREINDDVMAA